MSSAIAAARKRRTGIQQNDPIKNPMPPSSQQSQPSSSQQSQPGGLTLPQVIALVDKRLVVLEKFMSEAKVHFQETKDNTAKPHVRFEEYPIQSSSTSSLPPADALPNMSEVNEILDDYHNRFILLTQEITDLKDVILKLQSYTMDVNKMLIEERSLALTFTNGQEEQDISSEKEDPTITVSESVSDEEKRQEEEEEKRQEQEDTSSKLTYNPDISEFSLE